MRLTAQSTNLSRLRRISAIVRAPQGILLATVCATLGASTVSARPIDERHPADKDIRVTIKNLNGSVTVEGWDRDEVEITGELAEDADELEVSGSKSRLNIEVKYPRHMRNLNRTETDLIVKMPMGGEPRISVVNADVEVSRIQGPIELDSVNGDANVTGDCAAVHARSVNGRIEVVGKSKRTDIETVGGRVLLDGIEEAVSVNTVGADIEIKGGSFRDAEFNSVSGDVDFLGDLSSDALLRFDSHNGDVTLRLSGDISAEFEVSTFNGHITNELGPAGRSSRRFGPGREVNFSTGDGDARVSINTFNGDIRILRH